MESFQDILQAFFQRKDSIFFVLLAAGAVALIAGEAAGRLFRASRRPSPLLPSDDIRLQFLWSLIPLLVLACLASVSTDGSHVRRKVVIARRPQADEATFVRSAEPRSESLPSSTRLLRAKWPSQ